MIELPSNLQNQLQTVKLERQASLESLAAKLNVRVGDTLNALVSKVTPVDSALLSRFTGLAQSGASPAPNVQQLLQTNAPLYLVELQIQQQQVLTLTNQTVNVNQSLELTLKTLSNLLINNSSSPVIRQDALLQEGLRQALPNQQTLATLFNTLQQLKQLPTDARASLLPPKLHRSLEQLFTFAKTPQTLSNPNALRTTLERSGLQLERQLADLSKNNSLATGSSLRTSTPPEEALRATSVTDLKGALLKIQAELNSYLLNRAASGTFNPANPAISTTSLAAILKNLLTAADELTPSHRQEKMLSSLQQQLSSAVAKLQLQQFQSLVGSSRHEALSTQSWHVEIPVRLNDQISPLEIRIQQDWIEQKEDDEKEPSQDEDKKSQIQRQWSVLLAFELPNDGQFHAKLTIIADSVSATFWAEKRSVLTKTQQRIDTLRQRLEKDGINVKQIECLHGVPAQTQTRLESRLIDIKT